MKDATSKYLPGKRKWLKMKRDYLGDGSMADTADLVRCLAPCIGISSCLHRLTRCLFVRRQVVLGGYYGTGNKGGKISVFLLGVQNKQTKQWTTV